MATAIQKFVTADGKEFATQLEAEGHEMSVKTKEEVEAFVVASGLTKIQAGVARKAIPAFLAYRNAELVA